MRVANLLAVSALAFAAPLLLAGPAAADTEVTFVIGAFIGDELTDVAGTRTVDLREAFGRAPIFGGRIGWSAYPFLLEGSLVTSPSSLILGGNRLFNARLTYAEASLLILILPGPVSPFVGGGIGLHRISLDTLNDPKQTAIGYNVGGGVRLSLGNVGLRVDLRDHVTPLELDSLEAAFRNALGLRDDQTLHNVELSAGLTVRF